jgi:hypothetical protein
MNIVLVVGVIWGVNLFIFVLFLLILKGGKVESTWEEFERIVAELPETDRMVLLESARAKLRIQQKYQD